MSKEKFATSHNDAIKQQEKLFLEENFENLLNELDRDSQKLKEGGVVKGVIVEISDKGAVVDIGAKSVGFVDIAEFKRDGEIKVGDVVDVFLERLENKRGELIISRDNARRYINWHYLKDCMENHTIVEGYVMGKVKGGYAIDINGIICFLPRSQVDTILLTDENFIVGKNEKLQVLKIDEFRGNVVVSRRAILESKRNEERDKILSTIKIGSKLDGIVKNITDYGAFIDFGSFDGLLHLTDISWCRVRHPSEVLKVGQEVKVQVIKYDENTKRVSLGMKQLQPNPWETILERYPVGSIVKGKVTNITNYGSFVEIENGIEGLVHVSEMSWLKTNNPNKALAVGQDVNVMILDINTQGHRISLGIKQCEKNPWQIFAETHKVGDVVEGVVKNFTEFGLFIGFDSGVDGLIHLSDMGDNITKEDATNKFKRDEVIKVVILGVNYEKERISLGVKQLNNSNFKNEIEKIKLGDLVSCVVCLVKKDYIEVELDSGMKAVIKRLDLSKNKQDQKTEKFEIGDRVDAKVTLFDKTTGKMLLSIKDLESDQRDQHIYSESDSGTTIGSIAGDVLNSISNKE